MGPCARDAKIVCTLGPSSSDRETIRALAQAGMSVARLNASHGTTAERADLIDRVRAVDAALDRTVAVLLDVAGPEVRTLSGGRRELADGDEVAFVPREPEAADEVGLTVAIDAVAPGDAVLLDDGRVETEVLGVDGDRVRARVTAGGTVAGRVGVNVPGVDLGLEAVTEADRRELQLAAETDVDFVAASFVSDAADVLTVSRTLEEFGASVPVVAKVERAEAVANLEGIIDIADGVMVARGDLGVECPLEEVPLIQKRIIRRCHRAGVPVVTATEMLDSMIHERRPTRAEAADVANAVLDGTDAVMLSGETAVGDHPVAVVETMDRIVRDIEASEEYAESLERAVPSADGTGTGALARSARYLARDVDAAAVVAATESGYTARKAAKYRPAMPVVATTPDHAVRRRLALTWGVVPVHVPMAEGYEAVVHDAVQSAIEIGVADPGDTVVALAGMMTELEGVDTTNTLKLHVAAEVLASGRSVVAGRAAGPTFRTADGDLTDAPSGAVLVLPMGFDAEFAGDLSRVAAVVEADAGQTSYAAMTARELGVPMVCDAALDVPDGTRVRVDAERGVVYADERG